MVAREGGVQLEPEALDAAFARAVGRQEVQLQPIAEFRQPRLRHAALVDDVVVEGHADLFGAIAGLEQRPQQVQEEPAGLAVALDADEPVVPWVLGTGQAALLVVPGGEHQSLGAGQQPVGSDPAVQVAVGLIGVDHRVLLARAGGQPPEFRNPPLPAPCSPRTGHNRPRFVSSSRGARAAASTVSSTRAAPAGPARRRRAGSRGSRPGA